MTTTSIHAAGQEVGGEHGVGQGGRVAVEEVAGQVDHLGGRLGVAGRAGQGAQTGQGEGGHPLAEGVAPSKTSLVRTMSGSAS